MRKTIPGTCFIDSWRPKRPDRLGFTTMYLPVVGSNGTGVPPILGCCPLNFWRRDTVSTRDRSITHSLQRWVWDKDSHSCSYIILQGLLRSFYHGKTTTVFGKRYVTVKNRNYRSHPNRYQANHVLPFPPKSLPRESCHPTPVQTITMKISAFISVVCRQHPTKKRANVQFPITVQSNEDRAGRPGGSSG